MCISLSEYITGRPEPFLDYKDRSPYKYFPISHLL